MRNRNDDYPPQRPDHLLIEEYARQKSVYGCLLCDKTHRKEECEHKAKRTAKENKERYTYQTSPDDTYGSWG